MDTSKEQIKKCKLAVEIQEAWVPQHADYYYGADVWSRKSPIGINITIDNESEDGSFYLEPRHILELGKDKFTWLPRQDQFQELVTEEIETEQPMLLMSDFFTTLFHMSADFIDHAKTLEQLWLAYVMLKKFNKWWNGEDWVATAT